MSNETLDWQVLNLISKLLDEPDDLKVVKKLWQDRLTLVLGLRAMSASSSQYRPEVEALLREVGEEL